MMPGFIRQETDMLKAEMQILIVDDDKSFGKACAEAINRSGYKAVLSHNPQEALQLANVQQFQALVIDCMLPRTPGIELVTQLKAVQHTNAPVILMSGIYKDRNFVRQATQSTSAFAFLTKPFSIDQLVKTLDEALSDQIELPKDPLPLLFANQNARRRQILEAIELSENVHAFELPFIYALFIHSRISGQMNIVEAEGELFGISFKDGRVVSVESSDPPSQTGELLIANGFLSKEELEKALQNQNGMPLGQYLITENLVSPHAVHDILMKQMEVRLNKTIFDTSVEINFIEVDNIKKGPGLDMAGYVPILYKWVHQKLNAEWLKNYYLPWLDNKFKVNSKVSLGHPIFHTDFFKAYPDFINELTDNTTLQNLLDKGTYTEEEVHLGVHLLTTTRCLGFGAAVQNTDFQQLSSRLKKIAEDIEGKNYFEILNISKNARPAEIRRSYHELAKILHPDKLPSDTPNDIVELNSKVFSIINEAHDVLKDEGGRYRYLKELEDGQAKQLLKAEGIIERGKHLLKTGKFQQSLDLFDEAYQIQKNNFDLNAYRVWARLKILDPERNSEEFQALEHEIADLAQNDRRSEIFHFIKGLYQFQKGNFDLAKNHIENAVAINPNFLEARRELNLIKLKQKSNKPVDILRSDLKDVVGMLFKRKN